MRPFGRRYLNLIREFSVAGFKLKDQSGFLGFLWSFLNPFIVTSILYFLFRDRLGSKDVGYIMYLLIGIISWNFFALSTQSGLRSLVEQTDLVRNVTFPKEIIPVGEVGVFVIQHIFELFAIVVFIIILGIGFAKSVIFLPLILLIHLILITGVSILLSCLFVYVRDLAHIWTVLMRVGFFVTPIFYKLEQINEPFRSIIKYCNPMTQIITFMRDVLLYHKFPSLSALFSTFVFSLLLLIGSYIIFKKLESDLVEKI